MENMWLAGEESVAHYFTCLPVEHTPGVPYQAVFFLPVVKEKAGG